MGNVQFDVAATGTARFLEQAETAELLEQIDWEDLTPRLLLYASHRLSRHAKLRESGRGPDDYVQQAVTLVLEGHRSLSPEAGRSPLGFLTGIIDSLISHDDQKTRQHGTRIAFDQMKGAPPTYEIEGDIIARGEAEQFVSSLNSELQAYARLRLSDKYSTAEEFATALETTVEHVRNLDRRLRRTLGTFPRLKG